MPYEDAYNNFFNDRVVGQVPAKGMSLNGTTVFEWPMKNYFMNRTVGQRAPPSLGKNNYGIDPGPSYTTGQSRPEPNTPAYDPGPPTTVYSGDVATDVAGTPDVSGDTALPGMLPQLKMKHVLILGVAVAILVILIVK